MPKFPSIPRLSIVIPIGSDLAAFENTLISVLENRPAGCEVLVAEDGGYDDPFDLGDEVRFVVGASSNLIDLVAAAAASSRGRFVHVLADGIQATHGWIDGAIEKFEHYDAAVVAPVIRHSKTNRIVAAGWTDGVARLCTPAYQNQKQVGTGSIQQIGAYLQASLWRREVLNSMTAAFAGRNVVEANYAYQYLLRAAGWRCVIAAESELRFESDELPWDTSSADRGKRLRAIRSRFNQRGGWRDSLLAASRGVIANLFRPGYIMESLGQAVAPLAAAEMKRMLRPAAVKSCNEASTILQMPIGERSIRSRRAA